jgi:osmotically-inducible protein OsmY
MAQRNDRNHQRSYRDNDYMGSRQAEQFDETSYDPQFEERERFAGGQPDDRDYRPSGNFYYEEVAIIPRRSRGYRQGAGEERQQDYRSRANLDERERNYGASRYDNPADRGFQSFTSEDQGGRDFVRGGRRSYGASSGGYGYRSDYRERDERGFLDKAGDEIASWFGDEDAARRREMDHRGRGPSNYTRSDERILEDACDNLTDDWQVDARNIQVTVKDGEVTLDGTVDDRSAKRRAEDCVDAISGVKHVQNNLRVQDYAGGYSAKSDE